MRTTWLQIVALAVAASACNGDDNDSDDDNDDGGADSTCTFSIDSPEPTLTDSSLGIRTVIGGLTQPIAIAFLGPNDFFVTEESTGQVKRVVGCGVDATVLDLPVNFAVERGLLGIALHPRFNDNGWVYLYWTESSTGEDTDVLEDVGDPNSPFPPGTPQPLGNRLDRFKWDPDSNTLSFDRNLIVLHAFQADANEPMAGNHNGGVIRFEPSDGREQEKLYLVIGDNGRRGLLQNLPDGPFGPGIPDDQFGGPEPDNNHLTGVVLRLNDDGSTPTDNPFFEHGASVGGEVGANLQKVFAYGIRNSFGLAIDPVTGALWESENGDDSFDEINRIEPGHNGGWIQVMGPLVRIEQFKQIETTFPPVDLQQVRWPPSNIADSGIEARARMVDLPGSHYADPLFSWKFAIPPAAIGFMRDDSLGTDFRGDLFVGAADPTFENGHLFRFDLTKDRQRIAWSDPRLADLVADNLDKNEGTESESLMFGSGFGVGTDVQTGPDGNLFIVSTSNGAVYEIHRVPPTGK